MIENINNKKELFNLKQKIIIIFLLLLFLAFFVFVIITKNKKNNGDNLPDRTILIYLDGSDLESKSKIITNDLSLIDVKNIDLQNNNVLIYTGGTEKWHNFIKNDENAIYKLTSNGFEKIETYDKYNIGDPKIFSNFLEYGYDNYKAKEYDLIIYDHGGALDGAVYDDFTGDHLTLNDFEEALSNSPFNKNNKLENVIFMTCLNGSLEMANVFKDFARYLTASEESSMSFVDSGDINFINNLNSVKYGYDLGNSYLNKFLNNINEHSYYSVDYTYSVIDLSKIEQLTNEFNNFIKSIDLTSNYEKIAKIRSKLFQYGDSIVEFDMVDLKSLVMLLKDYSTCSADDLIELIDESVINNITNIDGSNGLSIYFPFNGTKARSNFLKIYNDLDSMENYSSFISAFSKKQLSSNKNAYSFKANSFEKQVGEREISFKLTDEQIAGYSSSSYILFKKDKDHPNYYEILYADNSSKLDYDGYIKTNIAKNLVKLKNNDGEEIFLDIVHDTRGGNEKNSFLLTLEDEEKAKNLESDFLVNAEMFLDYQSDKPVMINGRYISDNDYVNNIMFDYKDYNKFYYSKNIYKILDDDGNYTPDWEGSPYTKVLYESFDNVFLEYSGLENDEYYCVFKIVDYNGNTYYSNLVKVGD